MHTEEEKRLAHSRQGENWKKWGPYLSERQWGTVREDYSHDGFAWGFITHEDARSKAYRWGEDGIGGISDDQQRLCFSFAFWNHKDRILKERLFGLANHEGNHGEDVKELYNYLDSTPTHSYMKMLYKYPQTEFPYEELIRVNQQRSREEPEYEIWETGIFDNEAYFDLEMEYAKAGPEDILIRLHIHNRHFNPAPLTVLPTLLYRNHWRWKKDNRIPQIKALDTNAVACQHEEMEPYYAYFKDSQGLLFTDNETNREKLYGQENPSPYCKNAFHEYLLDGKQEALNPQQVGSKMAGYYPLMIQGKETKTLEFRISRQPLKHPFEGTNAHFQKMKTEADAFYEEVQKSIKDEDMRRVQRQAFAGLLWGKQYYYYNVSEWLESDENNFNVPPDRKQGRNARWTHIENQHIISMPDKWEYPWYAAWDLAFHCVPFARIDIDFAKDQLMLFLGEDYMHPNGQIPAYEWNLDDVNPPVHALAVLRVYQIEKAKNEDQGDLAFLERAFLKLLLNFNWWINRKDAEGNNIFEGGFLGLDNIGIFDRSQPLKGVGQYEQSDGTGWMANYTLTMLRISIELAMHNPNYQPLATKFFEHFLRIAGAMHNIGGEGKSLWSSKDSFFYDVMYLEDGPSLRVKVRSIVGLIPLFAVETLKSEAYHQLPEFRAKLNSFLKRKPYLSSLVSRYSEPGKGHRRLLSVVQKYQLKAVLEYLLDEEEFLSPYGIRSLSKFHAKHPYRFYYEDEVFEVGYNPGESDSGMFGGNSNWRGPIWFPINYMIIESLIKFHNYYGDEFKVDFPTGSGHALTLLEIASELAKRCMKIFARDEQGKRPVFGDVDLFQENPYFKDHLLFYEYFHGDGGYGLGASHQTGWTGLIADMIHKFHDV